MSRRAIQGIFILAVVFMISSCVPVEDDGRDSSGTSSYSSQGVVVSFIDNLPPSTFHVDEGMNRGANFEIGVHIQNKGEFPRTETGSLYGKLYLTGYDRNILRDGRWERDNQFNMLPGVSSSYPQGDSKYMTYTVNDIYYPVDSRQYSMNLMLNACYYYETSATATVCVDPDYRGDRADKPCRVGDVRLDPQKAPVQVTNIDASATSSELIYVMTIQNRGGGKVLFDRGGSGAVSDGNCLNPDHDEKDRVIVHASVTGLPRGRCSPEGSVSNPLRIYQGSENIVCRFPLDSVSTDSAYTTQMNIDLRYGYRTRTSREVTLINMDRH